MNPALALGHGAVVDSSVRKHHAQRSARKIARKNATVVSIKPAKSSKIVLNLCFLLPMASVENAESFCVASFGAAL